MTIVLQIEGAAINDIPSLYAEINRVFMAGENWQLGPSLDALDDLLHGGYGVLAGHDRATVIAPHWDELPHVSGCSPSWKPRAPSIGGPLRSSWTPCNEARARPTSGS